MSATASCAFAVHALPRSNDGKPASLDQQPPYAHACVRVPPHSRAHPRTVPARARCAYLVASTVAYNFIPTGFCIWRELNLPLLKLLFCPFRRLVVAEQLHLQHHALSFYNPAFYYKPF